MLQTFGVILTREGGAIELPVYWFEPKIENETNE
jgi:hypothetical protein